MVVLRVLTEAEVWELYERSGAIWRFNCDGDPTAPHAALTSELCTDCYVNSDLVVCDPVNVELLAHTLVDRLGRRSAIPLTGWIIGSAYGAITFSYEVARQLGVRHGFVKKDPTNPKRMVWDGAIPGGAPVLQVEELITTLGTALDVRRAVEEDNPYPVRFLPDVAAIIYRPVRLQGGLIDVIALVKREMPAWPKEECPLCKAGSLRLQPRQNWRQLTTGQQP